MISKFEVTQEQWVALIGSNPSDFKGDDLPVEYVSWEDCKTFCEKTGLSLPTEAQWEYACRAGTTTCFWSGDSEEEFSRVGWYGSNSDEKMNSIFLLLLVVTNRTARISFRGYAVPSWPPPLRPVFQGVVRDAVLLRTATRLVGLLVGHRASPERESQKQSRVEKSSHHVPHQTGGGPNSQEHESLARQFGTGLLIPKRPLRQDTQHDRTSQHRE